MDSIVSISARCVLTTGEAVSASDTYFTSCWSAYTAFMYVSNECRGSCTNMARGDSEEMR